MIRLTSFTQSLFDSRDPSLVGGKAANLGRLIRAGFPVPEGFVVTTRGYLFARSKSSTGDLLALPEEVSAEIRIAYAAMGGGPVAVRSSATAEDTAGASMAGQYETFLDIQGEEALFDAVRKCWASLDAPRTRAYLCEHGIDLSRVAMAVVVQRLIAADVAGVLFTVNPMDGAQHEMLVEATWGLGESLVSGRVQPDVLRLDRDSGRVITATIADNQIAPARRPCLGGRQVYRLWQLGSRTADFFGSPQDIEWAIQGNELYLVQSRPITTGPETEAYEQVLSTTRQDLREQLSTGRGPWVLHNLSETLPHPTPLTWSVIQRFMSGAGGYGAMYRLAGFEPSDLVDQQGFLQLISGRVYMDVSRAPEMLFENFPYAYDVETLKKSPDASQSPPTLPRGSFLARAKVGRKLKAVRKKLLAMSRTLDYELRNELFEEIAAYAARSKPIDLRSVSVDWLIELWREHELRVMDTDAPRLLLPSLISGMAMEELKTFLQEHFWDKDCVALSQLISSGGPPNRTVSADAELYEVGKGTRSLDQWLSDHGHRAINEFDLAAPRWREQPELVRQRAQQLGSGQSTLERHRRAASEVEQWMASLRWRLSIRDAQELDQRVALVRRYIAFREDGKDALMLGYDLLRDLALEAGRRLEIDQDVFFLTREELFDALRVGYAPFYLIQQRKIAYRAQTRITLPRVIDPPAIGELGKADDPEAAAGGYKAFTVSCGQASGPARILQSPAEAADVGSGYVLVCPSTDPSWTPLFVNAAALVLECGGTLSHGAVVAREMGLPAVVLPNAMRLFKEGEELCVDGQNGWVGPVQTNGTTSPPVVPDFDDVPDRHELLPPPPGRKDRRAAKLRNCLAGFWSLYLIGFFLLPPDWIRQPTLAAMDLALWPVVRLFGRPAVVALIAAGIAFVMLAIQRILTDNHRLREAKRRAAALSRQAKLLARGSAQRLAREREVAAVQRRVFAAATVPIGILLGPLVLPFVWMHQRIDPSAWNAPAGAAVQIVAQIDGSWSKPVRINVPQSVAVDQATPADRTPPPIRRTLERLLALYRQPRADPNEPWELQMAPDLARQQTADDLEAYLRRGVPPQGITWLLRPAEQMQGRFHVTVLADGQPQATATVVLGDQYPPAPTVVATRANSPVTQLRVIYPKPRQEPVFFRPFGWLGRYEHSPIAVRLASIDIGWIGLYILAYVPALKLAKGIFRVG